jgi:ribosomal-protein-alanine N-acetyltransferase
MPYLVEPVVDPGSITGRQPTHVSEDLTLRPWSVHDAPQLHAVFADPEIQRWHLRRLDSLDEARDLVALWRSGWRRRTSASWAVVQTGDPATVLGQVAFRSLYLADGMAECSYWVAPEWRRKGIASRATAVLADWALGELGLHRLELVHSVRNEPSCAVARLAGFEAEGTKRGLQRHRDGWHDMHLHSRVRCTEPSAAPVPAPASGKVGRAGTLVTVIAALSG